VTTDRDAPEMLLEQAVQVLQGLLPPQWTVEGRQGGSPSDPLEECIVVKGPDNSDREILVDARPRTTPAELHTAYTTPLARRMRRDIDSPILVISSYLSPRSREVLEEAGINYLDLTGNARIAIDDPGLSVRTEGARREPTPRRRPERGISGPAAGRIIRALADFTPPYSVTQVADLAGVSAGYASRTLQALEREALIRRDRRGTVDEVDWPAMLRRRGNAVALFDRRRTTTYIARGGVERTLEALSQLDDQYYAVTGSFAAARIKAITAPVGLAVYSPTPEAFEVVLNLLPAEQGADVRLVRPADDGVFARTSTSDGIRWVAPSQIVLDCLGGTGRMPNEGEAVLEWMTENEGAWRIASRGPA
jgi:DNA-binding transcriptional ArsR family regulator